MTILAQNLNSVSRRPLCILHTTDPDAIDNNLKLFQSENEENELDDQNLSAVILFSLYCPNKNTPEICFAFLL